MGVFDDIGGALGDFGSSVGSWVVGGNNSESTSSGVGKSAGAASGTAAPSPYTTPSIQPGQKAPGLEWLNWNGGGPAGDYYTKNRSVWESPSGGEVNTWGLVNHYTDPNNRPQATQNTQDFYNQFMGNMPSINAEPGFGAYYDHAKDRTAESINKAMGARGVYGSSAANDQLSRAFSDLDADRAKNEANYNLQRLAEQRAWQGLGGNLAGAADSGSLARSQEERNWANLLSSMGLDASKLGLARTNAGMDAAQAATGEKLNVGNQYMADQAGMGDRMSNLMLKTFMQSLGMDSEIVDKLLSSGVAAGNQAAANERTNAQDAVNYGSAALDAYSKYGGG